MVAMDLAYDSIPAFTTMFSRVMGAPPKAYLRNQKVARFNTEYRPGTKTTATTPDRHIKSLYATFGIQIVTFVKMR